MHLTTIVSLLTAGAAAAPAFKSLALNTRIPMPTPAPSDETLPELPDLGLRRRQEAEKDPLDGYLETLDGEYDEQKSDEALNHYHDSLEETESTLTTSTTLAAKTPAPEVVNSTVPVETEKKSTIVAEPEKNFTIPVEAKNETSSAVPEPTEKDPLDDYLGTLDGDYDEEKSEDALNHYHDSLDTDKNMATTTTIVAAQTPLPETLNSTVPAETKNETSSAAPEPTKKAASKDPLTRLNGALPLKRQEFPEKPDAPTVKRQLGGLTDSLSGAKEEEVATPEVSEKNVTTPAVPAVSQEDVSATTTDAQNATSSIADNTTAEATTTASDGYKGINKHMAKLSDLGLPVKRGFPSKINNEEVKAPEVKPEDIRTHPTGEQHLDAHPMSWEGLQNATAERTSRPSTATAGQKGYKNMSKLDWLGLPWKRQLEEVTEAVPKVDEETVPSIDEEDVPKIDDEEAPATPEIKSSDPAIDEKRLNSTTTLNETASVVNDTGADTGSAAMDGFHQVSKHASKLPVGLPVGLPAKRQAPEFLSAPVEEPEVADAEPTEVVHDTTEAESPLYKHLVPLK